MRAELHRKRCLERAGRDLDVRAIRVQDSQPFRPRRNEVRERVPDLIRPVSQKCANRPHRAGSHVHRDPNGHRVIGVEVRDAADRQRVKQRVLLARLHTYLAKPRPMLAKVHREDIRVEKDQLRLDHSSEAPEHCVADYLLQQILEREWPEHDLERSGADRAGELEHRPGRRDREVPASDLPGRHDGHLRLVRELRPDTRDVVRLHERERVRHAALAGQNGIEDHEHNLPIVGRCHRLGFVPHPRRVAVTNEVLLVLTPLQLRRDEFAENLRNSRVVTPDPEVVNRRGVRPQERRVEALHALRRVVQKRSNHPNLRRVSSSDTQSEAEFDHPRILADPALRHLHLRPRHVAEHWISLDHRSHSRKLRV